MIPFILTLLIRQDESGEDCVGADLHPCEDALPDEVWYVQELFHLCFSVVYVWLEAESRVYIYAQGACGLYCSGVGKSNTAIFAGVPFIWCSAPTSFKNRPTFCVIILWHFALVLSVMMRGLTSSA